MNPPCRAKSCSSCNDNIDSPINNDSQYEPTCKQEVYMVTCLDELKNELFQKMDKQMEKYSSVLCQNASVLRCLSTQSVNQQSYNDGNGVDLEELCQRITRLEEKCICIDRIDRKATQLEMRINSLNYTFEKKLKELMKKWTSTVGSNTNGTSGAAEHHHTGGRYGINYFHKNLN